MSLFSEEHTEKHNPSWWNEFLVFLWEGGFRSLIVFIFIGGALLITYKNQDICKPVPLSTEENAQLAENSVCSQYFELVYLIVGGYLGLSLPSENKDKKTPKDKPEETLISKTKENPEEQPEKK